jgi:hypothetical protein
LKKNFAGIAANAKRIQDNYFKERITRTNKILPQQKSLLLVLSFCIKQVYWK